MKVEFKYRKEKSLIFGKILRPVACVEFKSMKGEWIEVRPYIDSGADITLIPLSLGKLLGFELRTEDIKHLRGVGGCEVPVIITKVFIKIGEHEFQIKVAWALVENISPLLGRMDINDHFKITLDQPNRVILFEYI